LYVFTPKTFQRIEKKKCVCERERESKVQTNTVNSFPKITDGRIAPRSGLAVNHFIDTGAGVIDADYRGPVKVLLFNHGDADFEVKVGHRIAQLIIERIYHPEILEVQELSATVRGAGGFGSTGMF
jgi:dUTP pyrophosphatase